jgi:hypothetical protein
MFRLNYIQPEHMLNISDGLALLKGEEQPAQLLPRKMQKTQQNYPGMKALRRKPVSDFLHKLPAMQSV